MLEKPNGHDWGRVGILPQQSIAMMLTHLRDGTPTRSTQNIELAFLTPSDFRSTPVATKTFFFLRAGIEFKKNSLRESTCLKNLVFKQPDEGFFFGLFVFRGLAVVKLCSSGPVPVVPKPTKYQPVGLGAIH